MVLLCLSKNIYIVYIVEYKYIHSIYINLTFCVTIVCCLLAMSFLSPDDLFGGLRRKSLCNGGLSLLSSKHNSNTLQDPSKSKCNRRRGSFNEIFCSKSAGEREHSVIPENKPIRRPSLVSR